MESVLQDKLSSKMSTKHRVYASKLLTESTGIVVRLVGRRIATTMLVYNGMLSSELLFECLLWLLLCADHSLSKFTMNKSASTGLLDTKTTKKRHHVGRPSHLHHMWSDDEAVASHGVRPICFIFVWPRREEVGQNREHSLSHFFFRLSSMREVNNISSAWLPGEFTIQVGLPCRQNTCTIHLFFVRETQQNAPSRVKYH